MRPRPASAASRWEISTSAGLGSIWRTCSRQIFGSGSGSGTCPTSSSNTSSSSSSLPDTCAYSDAAPVPSRSATRRIDSPTTPASSSTSIAAATIASTVRAVRRVGRFIGRGIAVAAAARRWRPGGRVGEGPLGWERRTDGISNCLLTRSPT